MSTKLSLINQAYSKMRISGLTRQPTGDDINTALHVLENMAAEWEATNICTGYFFEDSPNTGSPHNVPRQYWTAYESNLAMRLLSDFGKDPSASLVREARGSFSTLSGATARVAQIPYPNRQPVGSGNTLRHNRFQNYYQKLETAPNECETYTLREGEVRIYTEHFDSVLRNLETVDSYTIESDEPTKLTVSADSLTTPDVTYTVTAVESGIYKVTIKATTSLGRIFVRVRNYVVSEA